MDKEETINFWCEIKNIFKKISDKFDSEWRQRKRVLGTELLGEHKKVGGVFRRISRIAAKKSYSVLYE